MELIESLVVPCRSGISMVWRLPFSKMVLKAISSISLSLRTSSSGENSDAMLLLEAES
jgi:hypothetical protein